MNDITIIGIVCFICATLVFISVLIYEYKCKKLDKDKEWNNEK